MHNILRSSPYPHWHGFEPPYPILCTLAEGTAEAAAIVVHPSEKYVAYNAGER